MRKKKLINFVESSYIFIKILYVAFIVAAYAWIIYWIAVNRI